MYSPRIHADDPAADAAMADCTKVLAAVDLVHRNISHTLGIPCRGNLRNRHGANLWGREPLDAITESSLYFIDVALIRPNTHAVALLANDLRLLAAARTRLLYLPEDDGWATRIREILARADSMLASLGIEGVLGAE